MLEIQQFESTRTLERSFEIPEYVVDLTCASEHTRAKKDVGHLGDHDALRKTL